MTARVIVAIASMSFLAMLATRELFALLAIVFVSATLFAFGVIGLTADLFRKDRRNGAIKGYRRH
jgi:hypothetical protein